MFIGVASAPTARRTSFRVAAPRVSDLRRNATWSAFGSAHGGPSRRVATVPKSRHRLGENICGEGRSDAASRRSRNRFPTCAYLT